MRGLQRLVANLAMSALIFLVASEVFARVALSWRPYAEQLAGATEAGRRAVSRLLSPPGSRLGALDGTGGFVFDPVLGWTGGVYSRPGVHVSAEGRRLTRPTGSAPEPEALSVVLLGDSFTFGFEVDDEQTFGWRLAEATGFDVRNLGAVGYGVDQAWLRWREQVRADPPDVVVLGFNSVSAMRAARRWDSWAKPWFELDAAGELQLRGAPLPPPEHFAVRWWTPRLPMLVDCWREQAEDHPELERGRPVVDAIVREMAKEVEASGSAFLLAYLPISLEYDPPRRGDAIPRALFASWCADGILCVDLVPPFIQAADAGMVLTRGSHWTPEGHQIVAGVLGAAVKGRFAAP